MITEDPPKEQEVKNSDVYEKNLDTFTLENQGVAKVDEVGIPVDRDRSFRAIVTDDSGLS